MFERTKSNQSSTESKKLSSNTHLLGDSTSLSEIFYQSTQSLLLTSLVILKYFISLVDAFE